MSLTFKRMLAVGIAALMICALFTGCTRDNANNNGTTTPPTDNNGNTNGNNNANGNGTTNGGTTDNLPNDNNTTPGTENPNGTENNGTGGTNTQTPASGVSVTNIYDAISAELSSAEGGLPSFTDVDDNILDETYQIAKEDVTEYVGKMPMMNVNATEIFIARAGEGKVNDIEAQLKKRQKALDEQWKQYLPDQYELVKNYKLVKNGDYVMFFVGEGADRAVEIFNEHTKTK